MLFDGYKNFYFYVGVEGVNFIKLWHNRYPSLSLDSRSHFILKSFTEFYIRTLEQAMISFYGPEINDDRIVSYNFSNVNIKEYKDSNTNIVETFDEDGILYKTFNNYQEVCSQLGITRSQLDWNMNVLSNYVFSPVANKNLLIINKNKDISLKPKPHKSELLANIVGIDFNSLEKGYYYLVLSDKKTIVSRFKTITELTNKTGIRVEMAKFRNKEFLIKVSTSSLDLDPTLSLVVNNLAEKGKLGVYLVSSTDITENLTKQKQVQVERVVSYDLLEDNRIRFHDSPKDAFLELKNLANMDELYKNKKITFSHFNVYYLSGLNEDILKKRIFLNRFWLVWEKDFDPNITKPNIPLAILKNADRRYKHLQEVISVDTLDNMKVRYHSNTESAFLDLCELLGLDPSNTKNNLSKYLLPTKPRYKYRFKLYWKSEWKE